jgi:hypothetical protein
MLQESDRMPTVTQWWSLKIGERDVHLTCNHCGGPGERANVLDRMKGVTMPERVVRPEEWFLFELMNGSHLATILWDAVGNTGENTNQDVPTSMFERYPELRESFDKAAEAMADFYQLAGSKMGKLDDASEA